MALSLILLSVLMAFIFLQYTTLRESNNSSITAKTEVLLEINQPSSPPRTYAKPVVIDPYEDTLKPMQRRTPSPAFKMPKLKAEKLYENPMEDVILVQ
jgi:hypothetical protein